jgi:cell division protein FtsB
VIRRWSTVGLLALLALVQAQLWFGNGGKPHAMNLELQLERQRAANDAARTRNTQLQAEVRDLREGLEMVEERARGELGMIKPDEILVQVTPRR